MLLNAKQVELKLKKLPLDWTVVGGSSLVKVFKFDDFKSAVVFVVLVGEKADEANHHPDVKLSWGKVEIALTTHEQSGLTKKDFALAKFIESIKI